MPLVNVTAEKMRVTYADTIVKTAIASRVAKTLPARIHVETTAKLLGLMPSDIQVLMATGKLTPLGDPAPNAPKWFAAVEAIRLATDLDWLHKTIKEIG